MKYLFLLSISSFIFACNSSRTDKSIDIQNEIILDSLALEQIFSDSTLKPLGQEELGILAENLDDTNMFYSLKESFNKIDSVKKAGNYEDYLSKLDIGMLKDIKAVDYKEIKLDDSKTLRLWGYDFASYEACPYTNGKVIFISTFIDNKNTSCIPLAYFQNWADAPFYNSIITSSVLEKNGNIKISEMQNEGGIDDNEKEYSKKSKSEIRYRYVDGVLVNN